MKKVRTEALLDQLEAQTRQLILQTTLFLQEDPELLLQQPAPGKWSVTQAVEHLNSYGRYYLPELEKAISQSAHPVNPVYRSGWLGDYFTRMMLPDSKGQVSNKMPSPKNYRPAPDLDSKEVLDEFVRQEQHLLQLMNRARTTDLERLRIPISIARFIRLKAGDTFRFLVAHHQRHFVQANNALMQVKQQSNIKQGTQNIDP